MPEKQFGHAGPKQKVFKMLPHHSEPEDKDLFPSFSQQKLSPISVTLNRNNFAGIMWKK